MPEEVRTYYIGNDIYDIPESKAGAFLNKYPQAQERKSYIVEQDTFDIPVEKESAFLKKYPTAKLTFGTETEAEEPPVIKPEKYSGKNLDIISGITKEAFSTNELFKDEYNKDIYFETLKKRGYTPDDIYAIKTRIFPGYSVSLIEPKPTREDQFTFELGGRKNKEIYQGTKNLFASDPKYMDADNRANYYKALRDGGVESDLIEKNIENQYQSEKILKGQGAASLINPIGAAVTSAVDMTKAGIEEWAKIPETIALEGTGAAGIVAIKGAADIALGALSLTIPGMEFIMAMNTASEFAPHLVEKALTPVSTLTGIKPESNAGKAALGLADLVVFGAFMKAGHKAGEYTGEKGKQFVKQYKDYDNRSMKLKELTEEFGALPKEQQAHYAELWADMKMRQIQGKGGELFKAPFSPEKSGIAPINDANNVLSSATELFKKEKQEFETAKIELTSPEPSKAVSPVEPVTVTVADSPAKLSGSLANQIVPKLQAYVSNFDKTTPINDVAAGLSVTYNGKTGKLGREDSTGEITFTDYSNGKTEIITGGGDITPFEQKGLKINEWYYSDKHGDYHVEGDNKGYTVYKIVNGKQRPVYEGDKINQERRDAIIRKATEKSNAEIQSEIISNKVEQIRADIKGNEGTPIGAILNESLAKLEKEKEDIDSQVAIENNVEAMAEVGRQKLQGEIASIESSLEKSSEAAKEILQPELENRKKALELLKEEPVPDEATESAPTEPASLESNERVSTKYVEKPLAEINIDESRFQNRTELDGDLLEYIKKNWDENELDPVVIWKDGNGKAYLLAGHHRLEAAKQLGKTHIDSRYFIGDEAQAIKYAKEKSNANRTMEADFDRAKLYRKMREEGKGKKEISEALQREGKNKVYIEHLSYLNPKGKIIETIKSFVNAGDRTTQKILENIADFTGAARKNFGELTDTHENEMFEYLYNGSGKSIKKRGDFLDLLNRRINGLEEFNPNEPLNFEHKIGRGSLENEVIAEIKQIKSDKAGFEKEIKEVQKTETDKALRDKKIKELSALVIDANKKIGDLEKKQKAAIEGDSKQFDIFSQIDESLQNKTITNETVTKFENRTEDQIKQSEPAIKAIESAAESADPAELTKAIREADELIKQQTDAIQEQSTEGVLPREQGETTKTGGEREGVGQGKQGETPPAEDKEKEITPKLSGIELAKERLRIARENYNKAHNNKLGATGDPFKKGKEIAETEIALLEAYVELAKEHIKAGVKTIKDFATEIGEEINDTIKKAWDVANNLDVIEERDLKSVLTRAALGSGFNDAVKQSLIDKGLTYAIESHKEAAKQADALISEIGVDEAVSQAISPGSKIEGANRTMILARAINHYYLAEKSAKTPHEKELYSQMQSETLESLDEVSRIAGQQISAINDFYKTSPAAFELYVKNKENKLSEKELSRKPEGGESKLEKIKNGQKKLTTGAKDEAARETGKFAKDMQKKSNISPEKAARKEELKKKILGRYFNESLNAIKLLADPEFREYGKLIIEEGAADFKAFSKKAIKELGEKVKPILKKWYQAVGGQEDVTGLTKKFEAAIKAGNKKAADEALAKLQNISKDEGLWGQYANEAASKLKARAAAGLISDAKAKPPLQEFVDGLVKNMLQKIKESLPEAEKTKVEKRPAIEIIGDAIKNKEKYKDVWDKTQAELQKKFKDNPEKLSLLDEYFGEIMDKPFSERIVAEALKETAKKEGIDIGKLAEQHFKAQEQASDILVKKLIEEAGLDESQAKELAGILQKKFDSLVTEKRKMILERMFPKTPLQRLKPLSTKRQRDNEKIVKVINAGAFSEKGFEKLFYEKFGLVDTASPEVSAKLKEFAEKLHDAKNEQNTLFYDRVMQDFLDYMQNKRKENRGVQKVVNQMYANMLYGPDTHIRNVSYNVQKALSLLGSFAINKPSRSAAVIKTFINELNRGLLEAEETLKHGYEKSGTIISEPRNIGERSKGLWAKHVVIPFRALGAMDSALNFPLRAARAMDIMIEEALKENNKLPKEERQTESEVIASVKELMGQNHEMILSAHALALKQTGSFYGIKDLFVNGKRNPLYKGKQYDRMYRDYERSVYNIIEKSRPEEVVNEAKEWADNALLMGTPKGYFGEVAQALNNFGKKNPLFKVLNTPYVNVPFNLAAHLYEYSPAGLLTVLHGKEGSLHFAESMGKSTNEISARRRAQLTKKAVIGTLGMVAVNRLGEQTYYDHDEKKFRPILIVFADGTGNYYENRKYENLKGSDKFQEYTIDFMGQRFSYKYSPFAPFFIAEGARQDYKRYHTDTEYSHNNANIAMLMAFKYFAFMKDQAAVQGIVDLLNVGNQAIKWDDKTPTSEKAKQYAAKLGAKTLRNLIIPNYLPQLMRQKKGLTDEAETGGRDFIQRLAKDVPFADQFSGQSEDHFGDKITQRFIIPSVWSEERPDNPLYAMAKDHDYLNRLKFYTDRTLFVNGKEVFLSTKQVDDINKLRNKIAGDEIKLRYAALNEMDNETFRDVMNEIYNLATKDAKNQIFGEENWTDRENPILETYPEEEDQNELPVYNPDDENVEIYVPEEINE